MNEQYFSTFLVKYCYLGFSTEALITRAFVFFEMKQIENSLNTKETYILKLYELLEEPIFQ